MSAQSPGPSARVLVVDDEAPQRRMLERILARDGYEVRQAASGTAALAAMEADFVDLVLTDVRMPGLDGVDLCAAIRDANPETAVILISGFEDVSAAVRAMKLGACDVLTKPCEPDHLLHVLRRALAGRGLEAENDRLRSALERREGLGRLIGSSEAMVALRDRIRRAAASEAPVLIHGESGVGKELVARAIHLGSSRASRPFKAVNVTALPEGTFERDFFGHVRGAFTSADSDGIGLFEAADRGVLFLDEIGELQPSLQPKLLRALEAGEITPIGSVEPRPIDVRTIAATNRSLEEDTKEGRFREDLFFRLKVIDIEVPTLAERREDIPELARHFLADFSARNGRHFTDFDARALDYLRERPWPGHVRELSNVIERAVLLVRGPAIGRKEFEELDGMHEAQAATAYPYRGRSLEEMTLLHIHEVLDECGGNRQQAAEVLGISRSTLWQKLRTESH